MITAPSTFRVIALISTFNEEDIIVPVVNHLINEGISVYIIDNWSTDRTWELVNELSPRLIGMERFPLDGPSGTFDWIDILRRKEVLSHQLVADWFMHHDADEIRESAWPGINLKNAIYSVDQHGYNAINFELLNFYPIDNHYQPGTDLVEYFEYFQFNEYSPNKRQVKAWKKTIEKVDLVNTTGGHELVLANINEFPYKFIMRHYPFRSQQHGEKKVFFERLKRFNPVEKEGGWHTQYDDYPANKIFLKDPNTLIKFYPDIYLELIVKNIFNREEYIQQLSVNLAECEQSNIQLKNKLAERDESIFQLNNKLAERDESILQLNIKLTEEKQVIQQLNADLAESGHSIQQLNADLAESCHSIQQLNADLAEREQEVLFYALSKSWGLTRPLRKIMKFLKGKRK